MNIIIKDTPAGNRVADLAAGELFHFDGTVYMVINKANAYILRDIGRQIAAITLNEGRLTHFDGNDMVTKINAKSITIE